MEHHSHAAVRRQTTAWAHEHALEGMSLDAAQVLALEAGLRLRVVGPPDLPLRQSLNVKRINVIMDRDARRSNGRFDGTAIVVRVDGIY